MHNTNLAIKIWVCSTLHSITFRLRSTSLYCAQYPLLNHFQTAQYLIILCAVPFTQSLSDCAAPLHSHLHLTSIKIRVRNTQNFDQSAQHPQPCAVPLTSIKIRVRSTPLKCAQYPLFQSKPECAAPCVHNIFLGFSFAFPILVTQRWTLTKKNTLQQHESELPTNVEKTCS